jgi:2-phosphosulfolactate phosphatase
MSKGSCYVPLDLTMKIQRATNETCGHEKDTVVVIDVLRAFTTAAFAFKAGVEEIYLTSTVEGAFELRDKFPGASIMGEVGGYPVDGFDFSNSPSALVGVDLSGRTIIQRTSAGTQGVVHSSNARNILTTGLCTVSETVRKIQLLAPSSLTLVETGVFPGGWGDEDVACADLIEALLLGRSPDMERIIHRVRESKSGGYYGDTENMIFPPSDLELALDVDRFSFSMPVHKVDGLLRMKKG